MRVVAGCVVALLWMLAGANVPLAAQDGPIVSPPSGTLRGVRSGDVVAFKGIPYALPPVGNRRWRAPEPMPPWPDTRPATAFAADCMQRPVPSDAAPLGTTPSEDCLYLNVWAPAMATPASRLPVLVWLHGGGFVNGGSSAPIYDGSGFARRGLVVVSLNYRLGRFGFFAHPALSAEQPGVSANFGYLDQRLALRWVQEQIAAFGGDPGAVTIAGESAGGQSVLDLVAGPAAEGLFHRAVVMSGGGRAFLGGFPLKGGDRRHPSAETIGVNFARQVGVGGGHDASTLAKLRALPAETITGQANMVALLLTTVLPLGPLQYARGPIVDGVTLTPQSAQSIASGRAAKVPLLVGTTSADLGMWLPGSKGALFDWFGDSEDEARRTYDPEGSIDRRALVARVGADQTMQEPARFVARRMASAGAPVWLYRFGYVPASQRATAAGAGHASELPYMFDTLPVGPLGKAVTAEDTAVAAAFHGYVANFARTGDPNGTGLTAWPRVDPAGNTLLQFTSDRGIVVGPDPWQPRLDIIERASTAEPPPVTVAELTRSDWTGFAAVGALTTPRYLGSDESRTLPAPLFDLEYRQRAFVSIGTTGLAAAGGLYPIRRRHWQLSTFAGLADRRLEDDDAGRAGLDDRTVGVNVGAMLRHQRGLLNQSVTVIQGLDSGAGLTARASAGVAVPLGFKGAIALNAVATAASDRQMRYDFGFTDAEAARRLSLIAAGDRRLRSSDAAPVIPEAGLQSVGRSATALVLLPKRMLLAFVASVTRLSDAVSVSPLVRSRTQRTLGVGLGVRF